MAHQAITSSRNPISRWVENHAGMLVSFFLHLMIFSFLFTAMYPAVEEPRQPERIHMILQPVMPEQAIPVPVVAPPPDIIPEAAATSPEKSMENSDAVPEAISESPGKAMESMKLEQELSVEHKRLIAELADLNKVKKDMRMALHTQAALSEVQRGKYAVEGAASGAVRTLDFKGFPQAIVDEIMARYDIRIEQKFVGANKNPSFLSYAETQGGVYLNSQGPGYFEVFVLSREAMSKMSQLEMEELRKRNLDPERTTVVRVVFGIIQTKEGHDLGIVDFETREFK